MSQSNSSSTNKSKVVDVHAHLLHEDWFPEKMWQILSRQLSGHVLGDRGAPLNPEEFRRQVFPKFWDPNGDALLSKMDECGIDISLVLSDDFGLAFGDPKVPILDQNRMIAEFAAKHPDRLKPFCVVDPRRVDGVEILERCVKDYGMFGIGECHPDTGWSPASREAYRMFEKLQEWGTPVLMHTGLFFPPLHSRLDHPMLLDDVCCDFPELTVIAGHSGRVLWWRTVAGLAAIHPNLYGDLAGFQTLAFNDFPAFCAMLQEFIRIAGAHKIMWASDDPIYNAVGISTKRYVDLVRDLPNNSAPGTTFKQSDIDMILGGNAQRALGL